MNNAYLLRDDNGDWFALLPNHQYKKIPYVNWIDDVDWGVAYYKVYDSLMRGVITDLELFEWDIQKILKVAADIRL